MDGSKGMIRISVDVPIVVSDSDPGECKTRAQMNDFAALRALPKPAVFYRDSAMSTLEIILER